MRRISLHNSLAVSPNGFSCVDDVDAELTRARPRLLGHRRTKMRDKQSVEVSDGASGHQGRPKRLGMAGWIACLPAHIFVVSLYCRGQSMKNKESFLFNDPYGKHNCNPSLYHKWTERNRKYMSKIGQHVRVGDFTASHLECLCCMDLILKSTPNASIITSLRDPAKRVISR